MDDDTPKTQGADDDSYVIEDTGDSIEEIEHESQRNTGAEPRHRIRKTLHCSSSDPVG